MLRHTSAAFVATLSGAVFTVLVPSARAQLQALGDLPGGAFDSHALGISADGTTVVGYSLVGAQNQAFRWRSVGGMVALGGALESVAINCTPDGNIVCGYTGSGSAMPTIWDAAGTPTALGRLPCGNNGAITDISDNGLFAVGASNSCTAGPYNALSWTSPGPVVSLNDLPGGSAARVARAVSGDGSVIAGFGSLGNSPTGDVACRWVASTGYLPESLGYLPGGSGYGDSWGISHDGKVIVGASASNSTATNREAFTWTAVADGGTGVMVSLGDLPGGTVDSQANSISDDKQVIVGWGTTAEGRRVFVWDRCCGMRDLKSVLQNSVFAASVAGWTLTEATGVSADGTKIAGFGVNPSGFTEAWLITLPCGPSIMLQPESRTEKGCKLPISFYTVADCRSATATYQWQVFDGTWTNLNDGEALNNLCGQVAGATTLRLTITPSTGTNPACLANGLYKDGRLFRCIVTNACGSVTSDPAMLTIPCPVDFDCDGFVTGDDFDSFVAAFEAGC